MADDNAAWFIDGAYLFKAWQSLHRIDKLDYMKLRGLAIYCQALAALQGGTARGILMRV